MFAVTLGAVFSVQSSPIPSGVPIIYSAAAPTTLLAAAHHHPILSGPPPPEKSIAIHASTGPANLVLAEHSGIIHLASHHGSTILQIAAPVLVAPAPIVLAAAEGTYVAKTRGAIHTAPLPGHINSASSINFEAAPGTQISKI